MASYNFSLSDAITSSTTSTLGFDLYQVLSDYAYQLGALSGMAVYSYYLNRDYIKTLYQIATPAAIFAIEDFFSSTMKDNLTTVTASSFGGLWLGNKYVIPYDANMLMGGMLWRTGMAVIGGMVGYKTLKIMA
jgi:hypothetical protein